LTAYLASHLAHYSSSVSFLRRSGRGGCGASRSPFGRDLDYDRAAGGNELGGSGARIRRGAADWRDDDGRAGGAGRGEGEGAARAGRLGGSGAGGRGGAGGRDDDALAAANSESGRVPAASGMVQPGPKIQCRCSQSWFKPYSCEQEGLK
jgi:hypothetical protein